MAVIFCMEFITSTGESLLGTRVTGILSSVPPMLISAQFTNVSCKALPMLFPENSQKHEICYQYMYYQETLGM